MDVFMSDSINSSSAQQLYLPRGLHIKQAAEYLGCTPWFIEVAIRSKKIPAHKFGHRYVLFKEDLDNYIEGLRKGGAGRAA
jgi:excisionase family DNA binding protein